MNLTSEPEIGIIIKGRGEPTAEDEEKASRDEHEHTGLAHISPLI